MPTYYEILGCDKNASYDEIKKCYHEQVKKCHPDKSNEDSGQKFFMLDQAWKTLRNTETRREYDLEMAKNDINEMPLYCEIGLSEMSYDPDANIYSFPCRCGGLYILSKNEVQNDEKLKIPCDECTFHIDILSRN